MEFRKLSWLDLELPVIGFGTWNYTGEVEPLVAAIDGGAFLDTAETYGTEEVVGKAIRNRRSQVLVATKVRPGHFRRRDLILAAENSLRRLGTDYIDLYQLHWPNHTVPIQETMEAMEELVDAGKVRYIGVSNFSVRELRQAQSCLRRARILSNQVRYSLMERTIENRLLQYCRENEILIIAFSPLGTTYSRISEHDPAGVLEQLAEASHKTQAQLALNWLIAKEGVIALPKASSVAHVLEDIQACGWRLSASEYQLLTQGLRYRRRSQGEAALRRMGRYLFQMTGRDL